MISGVKVVLFIAWLAWSRFRVIIPLGDRSLPSVIGALDQTFRLIDGVGLIRFDGQVGCVDHAA